MTIIHYKGMDLAKVCICKKVYCLLLLILILESSTCMHACKPPYIAVETETIADITWWWVKMLRLFESG